MLIDPIGTASALGRLRKSQTVPVVLSLALYGNRDAKLCTLANVLGQTVAPLVVHNGFIARSPCATRAGHPRETESFYECLARRA